MMRGLVISFILTSFLLAAPSCVHADDAGVLWTKGIGHYNQGRYDSAAACFEKVAALHPAGQVFYNLGNTYYRLNNVSLAVLNYKRALRTDPGFREASDNLLLTEGRIANRIQPMQEIFFVRWWKDLTHESHAGMWSIVSLSLFLLFLVLLWLRLYRNVSLLRTQLIAGTGLAWLLCLVLSISAADRQVSHDEAVVMDNDIPFLDAPSHTKAKSYIPEGTSVEIVQTQDSFAEVRLPDGRKGWMQQIYLQRI